MFIFQSGTIVAPIASPPQNISFEIEKSEKSKQKFTVEIATNQLQVLVEKLKSFTRNSGVTLGQIQNAEKGTELYEMKNKLIESIQVGKDTRIVVKALKISQEERKALFNEMASQSLFRAIGFSSTAGVLDDKANAELGNCVFGGICIAVLKAKGVKNAENLTPAQRNDELANIIGKENLESFKKTLLAASTSVLNGMLLSLGQHEKEIDPKFELYAYQVAVRQFISYLQEYQRVEDDRRLRAENNEFIAKKLKESTIFSV